VNTTVFPSHLKLTLITREQDSFPVI